MECMSDIQVSRTLALAIGWKLEDVRIFGDQVIVDTKNDGDRIKVSPAEWARGRIFDYMDWNVIGVIGTLYGMFPSPIVQGDFNKAKEHGYPIVEDWELFADDYKNGIHSKMPRKHVIEKTPQRCIAMGVISVSYALGRGN